MVRASFRSFVAWASPSAMAMVAVFWPSACRMAACFMPSARWMAAFFSPLARVASAMAVFSAAWRSLSAFRTDSMELMSPLGGSRSLISARTISMPHSRVCSSRTSLSLALMVGLDVFATVMSMPPMMSLSTVRARVSICDS